MSDAPFAEASAQALGANWVQGWKALTELSLSPEAVSALQAEYVKEAAALWNAAISAPNDEPAPPIKDRRFAAPEWQNQPGARFNAQMYLLNARMMMQLAESVQGNEKLRQRLRYAVQQGVAAASPSNWLASNPEALDKAVRSGGRSLGLGMAHFIDDLKQGHLSQTDEAEFEVGRNVATTEGSVVFENAFFQLLEYKALTPQVHERPLLLVPPCINKFYILDLQPANSLIRYAVEQGHRVFVISWRNADDSLAKATWDDYLEQGVIQALNVAREISGADALNTLGFCIGGTLLAMALAVLAARGERPAASMSLLTTFLDFSDTGVLDLFIDEAMVQLREMSIGPDSPAKGGLLKGQELASTFSSLRPNELVWNYVVGNYLKGETPPPFDLLYWNSDSTNLPGPMYCWYLRHTYLENNLVRRGKLNVCGQPLDLGLIDIPVYVYGSREDHIVPWDGAYRNLKALPGCQGKIRFVLGASGHIAGVINPPAQRKRSHWIGPKGKFPATAEAWLEKAEEQAGSWWPDWQQWLKGHAGKLVKAPRGQGSRRHPVIEPAPGRYVRAKA